MALNHLTIPEMVTCTESWVEPGNTVRGALVASPSLGGLVPKVETAHGGLLGVQRVSLDQSSTQLGGTRKRADRKHDGNARVAKLTLDAHIEKAELDGDAATVKTLEGVRAELFPIGLEVVNLSYVEEAGHATLLQSRMTQSTEQALAGIPMKTGNLLDVVRAWLAAGAELGRLEGEAANAEQPNRRGQVAAVRNAWMRMVNAVRTVYALEPANPIIDGALHKIAKIEAAAQQRIVAGLRRVSEDGDDPSDGDVDAPVDTPVDTDADAGTDTAEYAVTLS